MSFNPCYNQNCEPYDNPEEPTPCNGEQCDPAIDLNCVIYTGPDLPEVGIRKGDRGSKLLEIINQNHTSSGIRTENSSTATIEGFGTESEKLKVNVQVSEDPDNILTVEPDGLMVKFTPEIISQLFQSIKENQDTKDAWCELIKECDSCGLITDFQVSVS